MMELSYLPAPSDIVAGLRSEMNELGAQNDLAQFVAVWPHLETLSSGVYAASLATAWLGWPARCPRSFARTTGHRRTARRFFDRLLGMLEEAGMLESRDGKWKLLRR